MAVAHSFFSFMVEFDNYINILSSLAKMSLYFHFYRMNSFLFLFLFFMSKCTYSLRVGKLCWHDFECDK